MTVEECVTTGETLMMRKVTTTRHRFEVSVFECFDLMDEVGDLVLTIAGEEFWQMLIEMGKNLDFISPDLAFYIIQTAWAWSH